MNAKECQRSWDLLGCALPFSFWMLCLPGQVGWASVQLLLYFQRRKVLGKKQRFLCFAEFQPSSAPIQKWIGKYFIVSYILSHLLTYATWQNWPLSRKSLLPGRQWWFCLSSWPSWCTLKYTLESTHKKSLQRFVL